MGRILEWPGTNVEWPVTNQMPGAVTLLRWHIEKPQKHVFGPGKSEWLDLAQLLFGARKMRRVG